MSFWFSWLPAKFICMCLFFSGIVFFFVIQVLAEATFCPFVFQFTFLHADTCTFVFCIWGFAFVSFLLSLVAYACFFGGIVCFLALMYNMFCVLLILLSVLFNCSSHLFMFYNLCSYLWCWVFVGALLALFLCFVFHVGIFIPVRAALCSAYEVSLLLLVISLLCFSCRYIHSNSCSFVFCI